MLVAVTGTPGVGKTALCGEMEGRGYRCMNIRDIIYREGMAEGSSEGSDEILVDTIELENMLNRSDLGRNEDVLLDGHLSYLAPSDICLVLRLHPAELRSRLGSRNYSGQKIDENVEAEIVSVVLVEAVEREMKRSGEGDWTDLAPGCGTVFEIDATGIGTSQLADLTETLLDAYRGKRLNELSEYRPGRVDWLEVVAEWF